jgi:hypothetical protein
VITHELLPTSPFVDNFRLADHPGVIVLWLESNAETTSATALGLPSDWAQLGRRATAERILWQLQIKRVDLLGAYIPRHQRRIIRS